MHAVEISGLTHRFARDEVLTDVTMTVPLGSVYGFLGPNGAGKTTTLRLLLGLLRRQAGSIAVLGRRLERDRLHILRRVGTSIETPSIYAHLTATENLEVWRRTFGCDRRRVPHVLGTVGLADTGSKRASQFSLGMRQRLAIAVALLHDPDLLVLDEPTNGLDPHGIIDVRTLLFALTAEHGKTVLVSSHILAEVARVVSHVGVIARGRMQFEGTLAALAAKDEAAARTVFDVDDGELALTVARDVGLDAQADGTRIAVRGLSRDEARNLTRALIERGVGVFEVVRGAPDLERVFLQLVS
jgi:ABC-2 type transport system ATP-binding protein